jgi:hypothetical protein
MGQFISGKAGTGSGRGTTLEGLDWPGAVADIAASAKWLKDQGSSKVIRHAETQDRLRTYVTGPSSKFAKGPS